MNRFPKEMTENGIHYTLHGDYYFPDLDLPDSPRQTIGRYGRMRTAPASRTHTAVSRKWHPAAYPPAHP